jgi:tetratricopeptide (TPR) repeat protein
MAQNQNAAGSALEIDRLATQLAKDPHSKAFMPLAEEYGKVGMWQEAAGVLEDGLKLYPGFITAMVALGRAYDQMGQMAKAKTILEESVKVSPDNLRAHRTLIKIYTSQGLSESVLQSCAVILAVNPRDEEALSVQSALGEQLKHTKTLEGLTPSVPLTDDLSVEQAVAPPAFVDFTAALQEASIAPDLLDSQATEPTETALWLQDLTGKDGLDIQAINTVLMPPLSPHAGVVAQLEAWLRTIESRRHDRDTTNESSHTIS